MDETFDVPDSTDWLNTPLKGLKPVEAALRCHVCKDFYDTPMLTSCNHTFCSLCIRRCLSVDGKCPLCRANDQEFKLRSNGALGEAVEAFVNSRDEILKIARTAAAPPPILPSPKRKADELEASPSQSVQQGKRPRMSTRSSKTRAAEAAAAMAREEAHLYIEGTIEEEPYEPNDGLVACPICNARMKENQVDRHIDKSCIGSPQPPQQPPQQARPSSSSTPFRFPPSPSKAATKPPERLPALAYSMLKDTALRKKLSELGLSTVGARPLLERRHQEWITLWNANCDSARPKKRSELMQDMDVWERTVGGRAPATTRASALGAQIKDKEFDGDAWRTRHNDSFRDLIASARRTRSAATPKTEPKADGRENEAGTAVDASTPPLGSATTGEVVDLTSPDLHQETALGATPEDGGQNRVIPQFRNGQWVFSAPEPRHAWEHTLAACYGGNTPPASSAEGYVPQVSAQVSREEITPGSHFGGGGHGMVREGSNPYPRYEDGSRPGSFYDGQLYDGQWRGMP